MKFAGNRAPLPLFGRIRRFAARHPVDVLLVLAIPVLVAGLTRFLTSTTMRGAGVIRTGEIVLLMLAPTLLFGAAVRGPRIVRAVSRFFTDRRARRNPQPTGRPIEQLAGDLRKLAYGGLDRPRFDIEESKATVHRALELGINLFDTAQGYGLKEFARARSGSLPPHPEGM